MDERSRRVEKRLEWPMLIVTLLVVPTLVLEESHVSHALKTTAAVVNVAIWLAFVAEVVIMLRVVPDRRAWLRKHPLELAIVILTPPFLPSSLQSARVFRLLRVLRLARTAQLGRRVFSLDGVRNAAVLALITVIAGGTAFAATEDGRIVAGKVQHVSGWDGIWWAVSTITTGGYGDFRPHTTAARVISIVVMVVGVAFVALLTAAAAQRFLAPATAPVEGEIAEEEFDVLAEIRAVSERLATIEERLSRRGPG